jgi:hypothetical protein
MEGFDRCTARGWSRPGNLTARLAPNRQEFQASQRELAPRIGFADVKELDGSQGNAKSHLPLPLGQRPVVTDGS